MSAEGVRLTKAQAALLDELGGRTLTCVATYKPALKLIDLGYVVGQRDWHGLCLAITPAGRAALTAETGGRNEGS